MSRQLQFTVVISFLIVTVEFAACVYAPLLPLIRSMYQVDETWVQMTVSFYLLGLGLAAMLYGPLSDCFGRRPLLLFGLGVFCLASLLCAYAPSIYWLIAFRAMQGAGAGSAWAVGNSVVKDVTSGSDYTKMMTVIHIVVGFVPAFAPVLGSYMGAYWGWQTTCLSLFVIACLSLLIVSLTLTESLEKKAAFSVQQIFSSYGKIISNPLCCRYMIVKVLMVMLLFVDSANLSLIFVEHLHVSLEYYGYYITMGFAAYLLGGYLCHQLVDRLGNDRLIEWGLAGVLVSNLLLVMLDLQGEGSGLAIQLIRLPLYLGWGAIFGNATACIVAPFTEKAGAASALMIGLEMIFSFVGIYMMSLLYDGTMLPFAGFMCVTTAIVLICFYALRNHRIGDVLGAGAT